MSSSRDNNAGAKLSWLKRIDSGVCSDMLDRVYKEGNDPYCISITAINPTLAAIYPFP